ncbi:SPFH domain-containing protein [Chromobacterium sp. IIBBL 290-4]|uniref:SPFH domain-containing protein n=1 Tax=Chromobacterium sp. IIBBL 290-4 TaxID=2953890 RepID=UPI0020B7CD05|nr:SPFH domain-containing protein [Chromobacterium sp. IIBBL 290-4]UTH74639.1 SPFH domain-containing protein [Chromobacterium sp. IIBBL 290-4]
MTAPRADAPLALREKQLAAWAMGALAAAAATGLAALAYGDLAGEIWQTLCAAMALLAATLLSSLAQAQKRRKQAGEPAPRWLAHSGFAAIPQLGSALWRPKTDKASPWLRLTGLRVRRAIGRKLGWDLAWLGVGSLAAAPLALLALPAAQLPAQDKTAAALAAAGGFAVAFACLLLERLLASKPGDAATQSQREMLLALLPAALLPALLALATLDGTAWPARLRFLAPAWLALLSLEQLLRVIRAGFLPYRRRLNRPPLAGCLLVSGLRRRFAADKAYRLPERPGLRLRQSWALAFVWRAAPAAAGCLLLAGWLLSSLKIVAFDQRGVYERFGQPAAVWQPGLHIGLPWPLGDTRLIENGAIHQVSAGGTARNASAQDNGDRLWDGEHPAETMQLIASGKGNQQTTQLMSLDVRLVYRQGLSDRDALASYRQASPDELLRDVASQTLLGYFAGRQLDELLGNSQAAAAAALRQSIQRRLDLAGSGLELLAVVVQTLHPPAGAARAFHAVQAAQIQAQARVAQEQGQAIRSLSGARQAQTEARAGAQAAAAEKQAEANAAAIAFQADRAASQAGGAAFLYERYLHNLSHGLASSRAIIIDHRLDAAGLPAIDLRRNAGAADAAAGLPHR